MATEDQDGRKRRISLRQGGKDHEAYEQNESRTRKRRKSKKKKMSKGKPKKIWIRSNSFFLSSVKMLDMPLQQPLTQRQSTTRRNETRTQRSRNDE